MWRMKRTMKITNKYLMKEKMKVSFCISFTSNAYVMLLCVKILRLSSFMSVEPLIYASVMLTKK